MNQSLISILCCPDCQGSLNLKKNKVMAFGDEEKRKEEIVEGILTCLGCFRQYPIIDRIPRLCIPLGKKEEESLARFKQESGGVVVREEKRGEDFDPYREIEKKVREKIRIPAGDSNYFRQRIKNDIYFRVKGCEDKEKYVKTLNLYYDKSPEIILDIGGGQGGLMKCFSSYFSPRLAIVLDYDLSWIEIIRLRDPQAQLIRADARKLPFKKTSIDLVVSQAVLEHIKEYQRAIEEMSRVTKDVLFLSWNPNKLSLYDFGHLDAPITIFPKKVAKHIAILWHKIRRTGRSREDIISEIERTYYISTREVRNILKQYGNVYNVFSEFAAFSIKSSYTYRARRIKKFFLNHLFLMKAICKLMVLLNVEPQGYYIFKRTNEKNSNI